MSELITLVTGAELAPVSVDECKADLRIEADFTLDDELIHSYILAASRMCSEITGRKLIIETWKYSIDRIPTVIKLPYTPVSEIVEFQYYDPDNVSQTVLLSDLYLYNYDDYSAIEPVNTFSWPSVYDRRDAVNITFRTGYGLDGGGVPETIKRAIRLTVAHWYEHRQGVMVGGSVSELPFGIQTLLNVERTGWVG